MPVKKRITAQKRRELKIHDQYTIQPGCLMYDITGDIPIGNKALRAPETGARVNNNELLSPQWHGCNRIGHWRDRRVAFTTEYTAEHIHDK